MTGSALPKGLGTSVGNQFNSRIDPLFVQRGLNSDQVYALKRAVGFNDRSGERYIVFLPTESLDGSDRYSNANSRVIVYDYTRDAWLIWSNVDMTGGITSAEADKEIYFVERRFNGSSVEHYLYRFMNSGTYLDYQDHADAIELVYKSLWEFMGNPAVLKNFQRIKVYSSEAIDNQFTLEIETEKDFNADAIISSCSIDFDVLGYGSMAYGDDPYGSPGLASLKHKLSNGRATSLRVILKNSQEQTNIAVTGYELEMSLPYKPGFKS
jgi:hypothetical protein